MDFGLASSMAALQRSQQQLLEALALRGRAAEAAEAELEALKEELRLLRSGRAHATHSDAPAPPNLLQEELRARSSTFSADLPEAWKVRPPSPPSGGPSPRARSVQAPKRQKTANLFMDAEDMKAKVCQAIGQKEYNVMDFYKSKGCAQRLARQKLFENVTLAVIMVNAIWLAIDTDFNRPNEPVHPVFPVAEHLFCSYFFMEWLVRFLAFRAKCDCLKDHQGPFKVLFKALSGAKQRPKARISG